MTDEIKESIRQNKFLDELRLNFRINRGEYQALILLIKQLKDLWRGEKLIDKEIMQELYIIPLVIRHQSERPEYGPEDQRLLFDMWTEADNLVLELLSE